MVAEAVAVEMVEGPLGVVVDEVVSAAAFAAVAGFPIYLLKQTGDLWPVLPQWLHISCLWFLSFLLCCVDPHPKHFPFIN